MTRSEAAEHALRSVELEREAVKHCNSLDNPEYNRLMREASRELSLAQQFVENGKT